MPTKRPTIITVIGILCIVFGGLGVVGMLCCTVPGLVMAQFAGQVQLPQGPGKAPIDNPLKEMNSIPGFMAFQLASVSMSVITWSILLISGIGLLKMKTWGRMTGFVYAFVAIIWGSVAWVIQQQMFKPRLEEMAKKIQAQVGQTNPFLNNPTFNNIAAAFGLLVAFAVPAVVLVLMCLPAVKNGLEGKTDPSWEPDPSALPMDDSADGGLEQ